VALATFLALALPSASWADRGDAEFLGVDFLNACTRTESDWIGFCHGYVQAIYDSVVERGARICVNEGQTRARIVGNIVQELIDKPELQEENAASVVSDFLSENFPCR
jgi:hypothetical protein